MQSLGEIAEILGGHGQIVSPNLPIRQLLTDSRSVSFGGESLFFAIKGVQHDGHTYLQQAYAAGVRSFVVQTMPDVPAQDANYLLTDNSVHALQLIAAAHRKQFTIPVIGITGSNGKTIVKEWLYHLLRQPFDIIRSPKSYNSQIGVPLSVWEMDAHHELGIFEAGISKPEEMHLLRDVIQPTIGILTNIGSAHSEGFISTEQKLQEKLRLFTASDALIYCSDDKSIHEAIQALPIPEKISWSTNNADAKVQISAVEKLNESTLFSLRFQQYTLHFQIPYSDAASLENSIHALITALYLLQRSGRLDADAIAQLTMQAAILPAVHMRLELKRGNNNSLIINDAYSADIASLEIALRFVTQHNSGNKTIAVLSDFDQTGISREATIQKITSLLQQYHIDHVIGIGADWMQYGKSHQQDIIVFPDTESFLRSLPQLDTQNAVVLIKGARRFALERVGKLLEAKMHGTVLRIHLHHLTHNLQVYRSLLKPGVKTMAMVKAFSYGSGQGEVARLLAHQRVDYLAVAYSDEGMDLRRQGIRLPIMVMNPEPETFDQMIAAQLEPEIYSRRIFNEWLQAANRHTHTTLPHMHFKLDTGMHRLGFEETDLSWLSEQLQKNPALQIATIFTHLAATDAAEHADFTHAQIAHFNRMADQLTQNIPYRIIRHALNSSGISNYPDAQLDMVRLGIGLYGVDPSDAIQNQLKPAGTLQTTIAQIKSIQAGESVGYSRSFIADKPMRIATINIGYADGFARALSNGNGKVVVLSQQKGEYIQHICSVVGRVCMDMTMIDITDAPNIQEGDIAEIFGEYLSINAHAAMRNTIAYEVMTGISQRVKRVYEAE